MQMKLHVLLSRLTSKDLQQPTLLVIGQMDRPIGSFAATAFAEKSSTVVLFSIKEFATVNLIMGTLGTLSP